MHSLPISRTFLLQSTIASLQTRLGATTRFNIQGWLLSLDIGQKAEVIEAAAGRYLEFLKQDQSYRISTDFNNAEIGEQLRPVLKEIKAKVSKVGSDIEELSLLVPLVSVYLEMGQLASVAYVLDGTGGVEITDDAYEVGASIGRAPVTGLLLNRVSNNERFEWVQAGIPCLTPEEFDLITSRELEKLNYSERGIGIQELLVRYTAAQWWDESWHTKTYEIVASLHKYVAPYGEHSIFSEERGEFGELRNNVRSWSEELLDETFVHWFAFQPFTADDLLVANQPAWEDYENNQLEDLLRTGPAVNALYRSFSAFVDIRGHYLRMQMFRRILSTFDDSITRSLSTTNLDI